LTARKEKAGYLPAFFVRERAQGEGEAGAFVLAVNRQLSTVNLVED
jgi:hypothetical protein